MTYHFDESAIDETLSSSISLVQREGGFVHPSLRFVHRAGALSVHCDATDLNDTATILEIPRALLIPVDEVTWSTREDILEATHLPESLTPVQQALLQLHIKLYNLTYKLPHYQKMHPNAALSKLPEFKRALEIIGRADAKAPTSAAEGFLQTRTFGLKPDSNNDASPSRKVLMPLIDFLNHHPMGAPYKVDLQSMQVRMVRHGLANECYANYGGRRDCLDLALHYGYFDENTPFAHTCPVDVTTALLGRLIVQGGRSSKMQHPADPPKVEVNEDTAVLSHLSCNLEHPNRLRSVLKLALTSVAIKRGLKGTEIDGAMKEAFCAIRDANLNGMVNLISVLETLPQQSPAADVMIQAAKRQAHIVRSVMTLDAETGTRIRSRCA